MIHAFWLVKISAIWNILSVNLDQRGSEQVDSGYSRNTLLTVADTIREGK